jgi:hypothetical protein
MDWESAVKNLNATAKTEGTNQAYRLLQAYGTVAIAVSQEWGSPVYKVIAPDGRELQSFRSDVIRDAAALDKIISAQSSFVNQNYMKDSKGDYVPKVIAPNGQSYPSTDYTNQGATFASDGKPAQNTPTSGPGTAPTNPIVAATVLNSSNNLPTGYKITGQEPSGWATDPTGHMVKITDIPGASSGSTAPNASTPPSSTGKAMDAEINALYTKYFARNATQAEIDNWKKEPSTTLETFLQGEQKKYGVSGTGNDIIGLVADAVGDPDATEAEILAAVNKLKDTVIDPYYRGLIAQAQQEVTQSIQRKQDDRVRALEAESIALAKNITDTQKSLESSGMTFTGEAVSKLGKLAAFGAPSPVLASPDQPNESAAPTLTPQQFGLEGTVNTANRLYAESSRENYARSLQDISQAALKQLGTANVGGLGLTGISTSAPVTGSIERERQNALQNAYGSVASLRGDLTNYQQLFQ